MEKETEANNRFPTIASTSKGNKRKLIIIGVILGGIILLTSVSYAVSYFAVTSASGKIEISMGKMQLTGPFFDLTVDCVFKNPSDTEFRIDSIKGDISIESGSTHFSVGEINASNKVLPANGYVTVTATFHSDSNTIVWLSEHSTAWEIMLNGKASMSGKYLFWTITNEQTLNFRKALDNT
jgi:hypothetical protein